jgi:hypothetical protein
MLPCRSGTVRGWQTTAGIARAQLDVDHFTCMLFHGIYLKHTFGRIDIDHCFASSIHDVDPPVSPESFDTFTLGALTPFAREGPPLPLFIIPFLPFVVPLVKVEGVHFILTGMPLK